MYRYAYEDIFYGIMSNPDKRSQEIEEIIDRRAEKGWRYVQLIPVDQSGGRITHAKLVFEKKIDE